jgi:hypothetical protein
MELEKISKLLLKRKSFSVYCEAEKLLEVVDSPQFGPGMIEVFWQDDGKVSRIFLGKAIASVNWVMSFLESYPKESLKIDI